MKRPLSFYKLVMAAAVALPSMALADITPVAPQLDPTDNCYMIGTAAELYGFAAMVNDEGKSDVCGKLTDDITVNENVLKNASGESCVNDDGSYNTTTCPGTLYAWTPIGTDEENPYKGIFDGEGKTVSGLYVNDDAKNYIGLFGVIGTVATVTNVGVVDSYIKGKEQVGSVAGRNYGTISTVYSTGPVNGSGSYVGGVVGYNKGTVSNAHSMGSVSGSQQSVGGVAGYNNGTVSNVYSTGSVSGSQQNVGGVAGSNYGSVSNAHSAGPVNGSGLYVGGVAGYNNGTVSNVYSTGSVNGTDNVGGVVGYNNGPVSKAYSTGSVNGTDKVGGVVGFLSGGKGSVSNVYSTGSVIGSVGVGGVVGSSKGPVSNVYSTGSVNGTDKVGGVVGICLGNISNGYFNKENVDFTDGFLDKYDIHDMSAEQFDDGTVANALHDWCEKDGDDCKEGGLNGSVWGQGLGRDESPTFLGVIGPALTLHVYEGVEIDSAYTPDTDLPTPPTREGYEFLGWYATSDFSGSAVTRIPSDATGEQEYFAKWEAQSGSGCIKIATADDLYDFATRVNDGDGEICGELTADITVNEGLLDYVDGGVFDLDGYKAKYGKEPRAWVPMNVWNSKMQVTLDGNGKKISGLYINGESSDNSAGLFSYVAAKVAIDNLGIEDSYFKSLQNAGVFASYVDGSGSLDITNSYNASLIVVTYTAAGGLVGCSGTGTVNISQSYNAGSVINTGTATTAGEWPGYTAGGFVGSTESGTLNIVNSYNLGSVTASQWNVGGFVGYAGDGLSLTIANSYNMGTLKNSEWNTTNIVGYFATTSTMFAANNFFVGSGNDGGAMGMSAEKFKDGSVATYLHNYETTDVDGSVWGQAEADDYPVFSKVVEKDVKTNDLVLHLYAGYVLAPSFYVEGTEYDLPANLVREGYIFLGWYKTSYFSGSVVTKIPANATGKLEYYAKWMKFSDNCYEIASAEDLYDFAAIVNGGEGEICGKLTDNITVNENVLTSDGSLNADLKDDFAPWTPIGTSSAPFKGTFYGQGHTISGLYYADGWQATYANVGLFGYVQDKVVIDGVGIVDSYFYANNSVGALVGNVGGSSTNGISLTISNSYNAGRVSAQAKYVGGLVGVVSSSVVINNSYNVGPVNGKNLGGGLVGSLLESATASINNSYNSGSLIGSEKTSDDLVYVNTTGTATITNCFFTGKSLFEGNGATKKTASEFANGIVAKALHDWCEKDGDNCKVGGLDGTVWGQDLSKENSRPEFIERLDYKLGSVTFFEKAGKIDSAYVDAASDIAVNFPNNVVVSGPIKFKRTFAGSGYSTIMLPFTPNCSKNDCVEGVEFFEFVSYKDATVGVSEVSPSALQANTPYLIQAAGATELVFKNGGTFNTTTGDAYDSETGLYKKVLAGEGAGWTIYGTYKYKTWEMGDNKTYGFAGSKDNDPLIVGQFAKVGAGAYIYPMRAYLEYVEPSNGRPAATGAKVARMSLPETIDVVIVEGDETTGEQTMSAIGSLDTRTGEFKFASDRWFDLNGRYLGNKKPTQKGAYYNNGKKVVVK